MPWNLDSDRPIFQQIIERIQMEILSGKYAPGDKLPSVRDLAMEAAVNPNTMQKALSELERTGLVYTQRTSGRFITEDSRMIGQLKEEKAREIIRTFLAGMQQIGYDRQEAIAALEQSPACGAAQQPISLTEETAQPETGLSCEASQPETGPSCEASQPEVGASGNEPEGAGVCGE